MKLSKITSKLIILLIASGALASSATAGPCKKSKKLENIARYKTPEMVKFVDSSIDFLNSTQNPNKRHLAILSKCQATFSSGKKKVKGIESKNLKLCNALKNKGDYDNQKIAVKLPSDEIIKLPSDEIKLNNQKLPKKSIKKKSIVLKKDTKNITSQYVEKDNSVSKNDSELLLF